MRLLPVAPDCESVHKVDVPTMEAGTAGSRLRLSIYESFHCRVATNSGIWASFDGPRVAHVGSSCLIASNGGNLASAISNKSPSPGMQRTGQRYQNSTLRAFYTLVNTEGM